MTITQQVALVAGAPLRPVRACALATAALVSLGIVAACDDTTRPPAPGTIQVTALTSGLDPDADGYVVTVDGGAARSLGANGSITLDGVPSGTRQVRLDGVATNCTASDDASRQVTVTAGQRTTVAFAISCVERVGSIAVRVSTTGVEQPPGGYRLEIDDGIRQQPIGTSDTTTLTGVEEGQHVVWLRGLPDNCRGPNARTVTVAFGQSSTTQFDVSCVPSRGFLRITTTTTGPAPDPDGYKARVTWGTSTISETALPVGGTVVLDLPARTDYAVRLLGVAPNCTVDSSGWGAEARVVEVEGGSVRDISFAVLCEAISVTPLPAGAQLAFVRDGRIYRVGSDGTDLVRLTDGPNDGSPAWSPDGRRLAFSRATGKNEWGTEVRDIFIADADGSNVVRRTSGGMNMDPTWSPDGKRIAFACHPPATGSQEVCVMSTDEDGSGPIALTNRGGFNGQPAWSPDGRTIAFVSDWRFYDFVVDLYVMNADGSGTPALVAGSTSWGYYHYQPAWSPDGHKLAAVFCLDETTICATSRLLVLNADGSEFATLKSTRGLARPTWSPDGRTIAFSSPSGTGGAIWWIRADGTEQGIIVTDGHSPAWRP